MAEEVYPCECKDPFHDSNPDVPRMGCAKKVYLEGGVDMSPRLCVPCLFSCEKFNG